MKENYIVARVGQYTRSDIKGIQIHNERKTDSHANPDIIPERKDHNIQFIENYKGELYTEVFDKLVEEKKISTSGLKGDAVLFNELLFDVNSEYWLNYDKEKYSSEEEFAKAYFGECLKAAEKKYGKENIISAVFHADEINRPLTEQYGYDVWHYHMHVVAIPTVQKEKLWSKRCKDPELVGTVKEIITQVSDSKFWAFKKGEQKSYEKFQDEIYEYIHESFPDLLRGQKGSKAKHLNPEEYKTLHDENKQLRNENARLKNEVEFKIEEYNSLVNKYNSLANKYNSLDDKYDKLLDDFEYLERRTDILKTINEYNDAADKAEEQVIDLQSSLNELNDYTKLFKGSEAERWIERMRKYLLSFRNYLEREIKRLNFFEVSIKMPENERRSAALEEQIRAAEGQKKAPTRDLGGKDDMYIR